MNTKENTTQLLAQLNQFTRRVHQEDEVFLFDVHLCDNEIDRDGELLFSGGAGGTENTFCGANRYFRPQSQG